MPSSRKTLPTPHRRDVDLSGLQGVTVLGESAAVLFSGLLRLKFRPPEADMVEVSATWPRQEARALTRAMARSERRIPGDPRTKGQRDLDRFMIVVERVGEAAEAARAGRAQLAFFK